MKMKPGQRETEFIRCKGMMSTRIDHDSTVNFLRDVSDSNIGQPVSLLNADAAKECIKTIWNKEKFYALGFLQVPYVIQAVLVSFITMYGDREKNF